MITKNTVMELPASKLKVQIICRHMKMLRLHIKPDGAIQLSVPYFTPEAYIRSFLLSKLEWIERTREKYAQTVSRPEILPEGSAAGYAGFSSAVPGTGESRPAFEKRWKEAALVNYTETINRFFPVVKQHTLLIPSIKIRTMKSLWGSCNRKTGVITLNSQLFRAPQHCIDYVVLHELTHYLYKNHDRVFYSFIAKHMPDWKERQKYLNRTVALI